VCEEAGKWRRDPHRGVPDAVFDLLDAALQYTQADTIVVVRGGGYFPFSDVLADVRRARQIFAFRRGYIREHRRRRFWTRKADPAAALGETDESFSAVRDYQSMLIARCRSVDASDAVASDMVQSAGHVAYLRDYLRQQQLVHWALRDAGVRPGR
jgi:hypothetical protein